MARGKRLDSLYYNGVWNKRLQASAAKEYSNYCKIVVRYWDLGENECWKKHLETYYEQGRYCCCSMNFNERVDRKYREIKKLGQLNIHF
jgi:hypothetical protein